MDGKDPRIVIAVSILSMLQALLPLAEDDEILLDKIEEVYNKVHKYINNGEQFDIKETLNILAELVGEFQNRGLI